MSEDAPNEGSVAPTAAPGGPKEAAMGLVLVAGYVAEGLLQASRSHARAGRAQDASAALVRAGRVADAAASAPGSGRAGPSADEGVPRERIEAVLDGQLALTAEIAKAREGRDARLAWLLETALERSIAEAHEAGMDRWERRLFELGRGLNDEGRYEEDEPRGEHPR